MVLDPCHVGYLYIPQSSFFYILLTCSILNSYKHVFSFSLRVEKCVDPDQMASLGAI